MATDRRSGVGGDRLAGLGGVVVVAEAAVDPRTSGEAVSAGGDPTPATVADVLAWVRRQSHATGAEQSWRDPVPDHHPPLTCCPLHDGSAARARQADARRVEGWWCWLLAPLWLSLMAGVVVLLVARDGLASLRRRIRQLQRGAWREALRLPGRWRDGG